MKWLDMPPFWLAGAAALAWVQARYGDAGLSLAHPVTMFLGGVLVGAGLILIGLAAIEFRKHRTSIIPHQMPAALIQTGIFKRSRNPIYLADLMILAGLCLRWDAVLSLALVPLLAYLLERRFILPEEDRLRRLFRAEFARYAQKTRRWV